MEHQQEHEQMTAACREAFLIARLVLRAVAWYVERVGWSESSVARWYQGAQQLEAEQQTFFHHWWTWQQMQRQRLGKGTLVGADIEREC